MNSTKWWTLCLCSFFHICSQSDLHVDRYDDLGFIQNILHNFHLIEWRTQIYKLLFPPSFPTFCHSFHSHFLFHLVFHPLLLLFFKPVFAACFFFSFWFISLSVFIYLDFLVSFLCLYLSLAPSSHFFSSFSFYPIYFVGSLSFPVSNFFLFSSYFSDIQTPLLRILFLFSHSLFII